MRSKQNLGDVVAGACFGALLAAICFHAIAGLFPDSGSTDPVAREPFIRFLAMSLITVSIAVGSAWGANPARFRRPAPATASLNDRLAGQ
jgi:hypothetical protein